jgi:hypothetical protein
MRTVVVEDAFLQNGEENEREGVASSAQLRNIVIMT